MSCGNRTGDVPCKTSLGSICSRSAQHQEGKQSCISLPCMGFNKGLKRAELFSAIPTSCSCCLHWGARGVCAAWSRSVAGAEATSQPVVVLALLLVLHGASRAGLLGNAHGWGLLVWAGWGRDGSSPPAQTLYESCGRGRTRFSGEQGVSPSQHSLFFPYCFSLIGGSCALVCPEV